MAGKMSRNKGARGEREAIDLLVSWMMEVGPCPDLKRNLMQSREGGHDLVGVDWLAVEVKRQETPAVATWWKQTLEQAKRTGGIPFLMYRQNRSPWRFRVRLQSYCGQAPRAGLVALDADLTAEQARLWLQHEFYWREVANTC